MNEGSEESVPTHPLKSPPEPLKQYTSKKETPTPEATPLMTEALKDTPSKTVIQSTTPKASTESSMASSVLNFLFSGQSKPPTAEKTKENKEAPKSAPTVSENSKPRHRKPRSLKAKKTSSASLKSLLSKCRDDHPTRSKSDTRSEEEYDRKTKEGEGTKGEEEEKEEKKSLMMEKNKVLLWFSESDDRLRKMVDQNPHNNFYSSLKEQLGTKILPTTMSKMIYELRQFLKGKVSTSMYPSCGNWDKFKNKYDALRKRIAESSTTPISRKSRSASRSRSKSNSNTKSLSKKSLRSHSKVKAPKQKSKLVRRRKIENSAKERLKRKSVTTSSFAGRKITFDSESKKNRKRPDKAKKNKRSTKSSGSKSASASRSRSKIRAKIAAKRSSSRTAFKQKRTTSSFSKPRRSLVKSKRSSKTSSKGITSSRKMNVTLVDTSNSPPRSTPRQSKGPKNDGATDLSSIDVFPETVSVRRPSGLENICQIKSPKVLEMNTPCVIYNTSSIEVIPSNRQLLIQTAVLICDHDKTCLDVNAEAKPVIDVSIEENGKDLEESKVFLTRTNGMILIQRTSVVNNYWEKAEKVKTIHFQPLKFNVVRLEGSGKPCGVLQIHLMQEVRAEGGQLSRREAVVVNFGDEAFIQEESESLRKLMRENSAAKIGKEHERGYSFFEEMLDKEKTISVSREIGISKAIWNAGERVEKIEDIKICCGGQEIPLEKNNVTKGSSTTSVEMTPGNFQSLPPKIQTPVSIPSSSRIQLSPEQLQQLTEEKEPPSQLRPETTRTMLVPAVAVKSDGPVISRLSTKPEGRIILNAPLEIAQVIPLLVINDGPAHVAWSLKTTRPSHFEANPAFGILQPGTRIHAFVGFAGFVGGEEPKKSDRLTVMWTDVEEGTTFCRELFEKDDIVTGKKLIPVEYNE